MWLTTPSPGIEWRWRFGFDNKNRPFPSNQYRRNHESVRHMLLCCCGRGPTNLHHHYHKHTHSLHSRQSTSEAFVNLYVDGQKELILARPRQWSWKKRMETMDRSFLGKPCHSRNDGRCDSVHSQLYMVL